MMHALMCVGWSCDNTAEASLRKQATNLSYPQRVWLKFRCVEAWRELRTAKFIIRQYIHCILNVCCLS